jgi:phosphatidylglycerophosphatase A
MSGLRPHDCRDPRILLATGFGSGFAPRAPGTVGSVVALPIWWLMLAGLPFGTQAAVVAVAIVAGIWVVDGACRRAGVEDDQRIVLDEWLGLWVTLLACPRALAPAFLGLVLFPGRSPGSIGGSVAGSASCSTMSWRAFSQRACCRSHLRCSI